MVSQIRAWEPQADGPGGFADEAALVAGLRAAKPQAFEALHAAYAGPIYNLALRIVDDAHEAQDVAQEVLIKVLRGLPQDEGDLRLPAWLYRVTVNAAFDHVRARRRRPATVNEAAAPEAAAAVDEYERAELAQRVESTLRELPKRQQLALVLRDVHGLSVGETAGVLGVTKGSADVLLSRARAGFRKVYLTAVRPPGRCAEADRILAGGVGGGISTADRAALELHAKDCPDCRRTAELWSVAPVGLGLLLPQVALPAKLSLGATLAAAQAAGVALPAGLGAAAATGAAASAAAGPGAAASAAGATAAAAPVAATAAGTGVLAALGAAAGVKVAAIAAVAATAVGIAGVAAHERAATQEPAAVQAAWPTAETAPAADGGMRARTGDGERVRQLARAHRSGAVDGGARGATTERGDEAQPSRASGTAAGAGSGGGSQGGGQTGSATSGGSGGGGAASGGGSATTTSGGGSGSSSPDYNGSGSGGSGGTGGESTGGGGSPSGGSGAGTGGQASGG